MGGADRHTLTTAQLAAHTHPVVALTASGSGYSLNALADAGGTRETAAATGSAGSGQPHPIVQPTIVLNYIIKT